MVSWFPTCFAVDAAEARTAINEAESSLNYAFTTVAFAEDAGANIEGLTEQLEIAGDFLSEAHLEFRAENYEDAIHLAVECGNTVNGLADEAVRLMGKTEREKTDSLVLTVVGSGVGLILLVVLGITGWNFLKKRHYGRAFEMKPEVEESR
jgi:hypothetical protein